MGGLRVGAEFEDAIGELLYRLGFTIIDEDVEIPCKLSKHEPKKSHEADLICSFGSPIFLKPWCSTKNVLIQCQYSLTPAQLGKSAEDLGKDIECFKDSGYDVEGGILVTGLNIRNPKDRILRNIYFWELKRLFLYSFKVFTLADMKSVYEQLPKEVAYRRDLLREHEISKGLTFLWGVLEEEKNKRVKYSHNFECFHDVSRSRFNEKKLAFLIGEIKKLVYDKELRPAKVYVTIHSISGFTRSVKKNIEKMVKFSSERGFKIDADSYDLFDYSIAPWQPILGMVYE